MVVSLYKRLMQYVLDLKSMFDTYEERAINKSGQKKYRNVHKKKRKLIADEKTEEIYFKSWNCFRVNIYYLIINKLHSEPERRKSYYDETNKKFNFLFQTIKLLPSEVYKIAEILQNM